MADHTATLQPPGLGRMRWAGLVLAPALAAVAYLMLPDAEPGVAVAGLSHAGKVVAAVGVLMALLWITEALPIPATALIPLALFPLLTAGEIGIKEAAAPYAHELIFLFMGGFLIALAMQRWGLHRRVALRIVLAVGTKPPVLVAGFMIATALLSMWVSNTATVVMMLPVGTSVIELVRRRADRSDVAGPPLDGADNFPVCLMLGIAYAASIGGVGTLVGTPPNVLLAAFIEEQYGIEISFARWMTIGLPLVAVFLPITWFLLTRVVFPIHLKELPGGRDLIRRQLDDLGPVSFPERVVMVVFLLTATTWIIRPLLVDLALPGGTKPLAGLTDPGVAIGAALLLFACPVGKRHGGFLLTWREAKDLPWGVLILFGGGLSLASGVSRTGVAEFIGGVVSRMDELPAPVVTLLVVTLVIFLTELTSNTATTAAFLPILGAAAVGLGLDPMLLVIPAAVAASCAFMLPAATPPNAIVFASGEITIPQMCKAGLPLNLIGVILVTLLTYAVVVPFHGAP